MSPNELAMVCNKQFLLCDHMSWISNQLNKQSPNSLCIYLNFVRNVKNFVARVRDKNMLHTVNKLCFLIKVGKYASETFLGSDERQGIHWTALFYDRK